MVVSREEAAASLKEISQAGQKMGRLKAYSNSAPHFLIWGVVWLVANSVNDLAPQYAGVAWPVMLLLGAIGSFVAGFISARRTTSQERQNHVGMNYSSRFGLLGGIFFLFFLCWFTIHPVPDMRVGNALISVFFPFIYMAVGVFAGWRLFAIGAVSGVLIMIGYLFVHEHYFLWMGVVAGGSLILGGLWLRKA